MTLRTLRIFISSPGDVAEERVIARRVIGRLDAQFGDSMRCEAAFWEHAPLVATASFQEQLLRPSETDIVVVILWSRLGTALPSHLRRADGSAYASGTEFEFEDAIEAFRRTGRPRVLVYRKTAPAPASGDLEALEDIVRQKQALEGFVSRWLRNDADGSLKAAFHNFASPADLEELLEAHLTSLATAHLPAGAPARGGAPTWRGRSPFRGLEAFEPIHAPVFFGRTAAVASVLAKLRAQHQAGRAFVLVVSMSGGGKSSLVRAGVLPLLTQPGVVGTARSFRQAVMRPSDGRGDPLGALERALMRATAAIATNADDRVAAARPEAAHWSAADFGPLTIARLDALASTALETGSPASASPASALPADVSPAADPTCDLALVVDQLEECFSDTRIGPGAREAFFVALDALARSGRVHVIATLRSDAYARVAEQPLLVALKEGDGQHDLQPPSLREIGQIIRFPAAAAGLRFEVRPQTGERLDDLIRDAAARNPGALPLLQFLLEELYRRRAADDVLTFRAYDDLGGVEGALAQRAEAVYAGAGEAARDALPNVLRELVTFGTDDDSKALRRMAPRSAFRTPAEQALVDAMVEARLLVSTRGSDGESAISLAHEALIEFWPRLRAWRDADREMLLVHARLAAATRLWERSGRSAELLLARGKPLAEAQALQRAGRRLDSAEATLIERSARRARRFAQLRAGAVASLGVLAVIAAFSAYRANVESGRARTQATTAQRTTDFMVSLFTVADPDENQGAKLTVREILDRGVTQIQAELQGEEGVRANMLRAMGQAYNGLGLYPKARDVLDEAVAQAERGGVPADLLKARMALAYNRFQDADYDAAEAQYRQALALARATSGPASAAAAQAMTGLGESLAEKDGGAAEAESLYRQALALDLALHGERHLDTARTLDALGRLLFFAGRYQEAEPLYRRAIEVQKALYGPGHSNVALGLNNLATLYAQTGRYPEAVAVYTEALPIYRSVFGNRHKYVAGALNNLGRAELLTGHVDSAEAHLAEAVEIDRQVLSPGHDELILPLNSLAMARMAHGDAAGAAAVLDEALAIARSRKHWMLNQVLGNEAELALLSGRVAESEALLQEARAVLQRQYGAALQVGGQEGWRPAVLDLTEAAIALRRNDAVRAQRLLDGALPVLEARFGPRGYYVERAVSRLAEAHARNGRPDEARRLAARLAATR